MIYATKLSQVFGPDLAENTDIVFASDGGEVVYYDHYLYQPEKGKKCQEWALNSGKVTDPDYLDKLHLASDDYKLTIVDGYVYTKERSETKYLVSFEGAGASGEMNSIYVDSDEMFRFPECAFEKHFTDFVGLRQLIVRPYRIIYEAKDDVCNILGVMRASRLIGLQSLGME